MDYFREYAISPENMKELKQMSNVGGRLKFIREKAEEHNAGEFTVNKLAQKVGTAQSTIWRIEENELQDPKGSLMVKIARSLSVPVDVFYPDYYDDENPKPFIICGYRRLTFDVDMLEPVYRIVMNVTAYTRDNIPFQKLEKTCGVSVLEIDEVFDEVASLAEKIHKRRDQWQIKKEAFEKLKKLSEPE